MEQLKEQREEMEKICDFFETIENSFNDHI